MASAQTSAVIARLLDDDFLHERIGDAASGIRDAYGRARRLPPEKAVQDKAIYDRVRQAATSGIEATRRLFAEPEPPPRHRGRIALVLLATAAVVVWAARRHDAASAPDTGSGEPATRS